MTNKVQRIKELAGKGHNQSGNDELCKKYVETLYKLEQEKQKIVSKIKEEKRSAKDDGFKIMSLSSAVKELGKTREQRDARKNFEQERDRITALCSDLPLFQAA